MLYNAASVTLISHLCQETSQLVLYVHVYVYVTLPLTLGDCTLDASIIHSSLFQACHDYQELHKYIRVDIRIMYVYTAANHSK